MNRRTKFVLAGALAIAAVGGSAAAVAATAAGGDDENSPAITGSALDQASAAALAETGGGTVTETEVGDEESYYEVEVRLDDGSSVDVQLDKSFNVVGSEADGANEKDENEGN